MKHIQSAASKMEFSQYFGVFAIVLGISSYLANILH